MHSSDSAVTGPPQALSSIDPHCATLSKLNNPTPILFSTGGVLFPMKSVWRRQPQQIRLLGKAEECSHHLYMYRQLTQLWPLCSSFLHSLLVPWLHLKHGHGEHIPQLCKLSNLEREGIRLVRNSTEIHGQRPLIPVLWLTYLRAFCKFQVFCRFQFSTISSVQWHSCHRACRDAHINDAGGVQSSTINTEVPVWNKLVRSAGRLSKLA